MKEERVQDPRFTKCLEQLIVKEIVYYKKVMRPLIFIIGCFVSLNFSAQRSSMMTPTQRGEIMLIEKKMQRIGAQFLADTNQDARLKGTREFVKLLVEALKVENSFQYKFDSLPYLATVMPEDSSFRIFTFQVVLQNITFRHYGTIQLNRKNIKLIPLRDFSDTFPVTPQSTLTNKNWLGAVYYRIITKKVNDKPVYFLFGFDQNDILSDKKYIEAMWIEKDSIAKFGMPIFEKTTTEIIAPRPKKFGDAPSRPEPPIVKTKTYYRYVLDYRKGSGVSVKYDKAKDMIIHDHTPPMDGKNKDIGFIKVPDGTYEGLQWKKDKWVWQEYVKMADKETNGEYRPAPLKDRGKLPPRE